MDSYTGEVTGIYYENEGKNYRVLGLKQLDGKPLKIVGVIPKVHVGELLKVSGVMEPDKNRSGMVLKVSSVEKELPKTKNATYNFLKSGLIKGIGPKIATDLINNFGEHVFDVIENSPEKLISIKSIGIDRQREIVEGWHKYRNLHELMQFLNAFDFSVNKVQKIYNTYGESALKQIKQNPYRLVDDFSGIGFERVDKVALKLGCSINSRERIQAGIKYCLDDVTHQGHVCYPLVDLLEKASKLLGVEKSEFKSTIIQMSEQEDIKFQATTIKSNPFVYLKHLFDAEVHIKEDLEILKTNEYKISKTRSEIYTDITELEKEFGISLSSEQKEAVYRAATEKLFILTGGPGTGKTTICNFIVAYFYRNRKKISLCSPTGKASQRLSELTGKEASTIHKLLGWDFEARGFIHNEHNKFETDAILIDEFSMVDIHLFKNVLKALPEHVHIILVGDTNQLPSVQPGDVLNDFIQSGVFNVVKLQKVFRQAEKSYIIKASHAINRGENIPLYAFSKENLKKEIDFFFIEKEDVSLINEEIKKLTTKILPQLGYTKEDIQILTPMKKYENGVHNINNYLQDCLNPADVLKSEISMGGVLYRVGDRVIQMKNNYMHEVFNGDVGTIKDVDLNNQVIEVEFTSKNIEYSFAEADELSLAYALTIHKSQGSQYPVIVMPISYEHKPMLYKNLIYTGITRATKLVIVVGERKHFLKAANTEDNKKRYSCLLTRLKEIEKGDSSAQVYSKPISKVSYQEFLRKKKPLPQS